VIVAVTRDDVERVARLAQLELSEDEAAGMVRDLNAVLEYAGRVSALDTEGIDPAEGSGGEATPLREDAVEPSLAPGRATAGAPGAERGLFKVPPAFETE
jgi:aspartyl-tRNA(Asn)/glutamyl-tRNA(Gln) amidotransferase subunit C